MWLMYSSAYGPMMICWLTVQDPYLWAMQLQRNNVIFTLPYLVQHTLKGIPEQSEIGVQSLFEHYGSCTVSQKIMTISRAVHDGHMA